MACVGYVRPIACGRWIVLDHRALGLERVKAALRLP